MMILKRPLESGSMRIEPTSAISMLLQDFSRFLPMAGLGLAAPSKKHSILTAEPLQPSMAEEFQSECPEQKISIE